MSPPASLVIEEIHKCISGASNMDRDWELFASLFTPNATLNIVINDGTRKIVESKSVSEYIDDFIATVQDRAYYEKMLTHRIEYVNSFAVAWSEYEARITMRGNPAYMGTNCFQLFFDGTRWQIISITWERKTKVSYLFNGYSIL